MSAKAPAGKVNKKKGREAAVDNSERRKGEGLIKFITQVAAMSWAETQQPETTLASQSLRKTGFLSAIQIEVEVLLIRGILKAIRVCAKKANGFLPQKNRRSSEELFSA